LPNPKEMFPLKSFLMSQAKGINGQDKKQVGFFDSIETSRERHYREW
jgi:hypothetical protein